MDPQKQDLEFASFSPQYMQFMGLKYHEYVVLQKKFEKLKAGHHHLSFKYRQLMEKSKAQDEERDYIHQKLKEIDMQLIVQKKENKSLTEQISTQNTKLARPSYKLADQAKYLGDKIPFLRWIAKLLLKRLNR